MPKKSAQLAAEIQAMMVAKNTQVLTMTWKKFYEEAEMSRYTDERSRLHADAFDEIGIIYGRGKNVVTFCNDSNFAS